jgi:aspartate oxidase
LADDPGHDVELCRPDPKRETSEPGHADLARTRPRDRAFYEKCEVSDSIIGLRNGILTALLILEAAQQSRESRGCHYRIN